MQVIYMSSSDTILMDIFAWLFFHISIGYWCSRIPVSKFNPQKAIYLTHSWEKGGEIYERLFHVRSWKKYIPAGGKLYPDTFSLQKLSSFNKDYLELWLKESCRAEFCHLVMVIPGFLFFLWNSTRGGCLMVAYSLLNNFFPIILQRFNRPRIRRLIEYFNTSAYKYNGVSANIEKKSYDPEKVFIPHC